MSVSVNAFKAQLQQLIGPDIAAFQRRYQTVIRGTPYPTIRTIGDVLLSGTGKQLRPILAILVYRALTETAEPKLPHLCAALELLHVASLVHDDVIDAADLRHGQPALHQTFGTELAIPYGVYLYSLSLREIAALSSIPILTEISRTVSQLCVGEIVQVGFRDRLSLSVPEYLTILKKKTGVLFATACVSAGILTGLADKKILRGLSTYGTALGIAFQLADDYLDIMGDASGALKKKPGQDFLMGELTLPLLILRDSLSPVELTHWHAAMQEKTPEALHYLQEKITATPGVGIAVGNLLTMYLERAKQALVCLPTSPYKESLLATVDYVAKRSSLY